MFLNRKKEIKIYELSEINGTRVVLTCGPERIEVQKYKMPLELEVGNRFVQNEFGMFEKI